MTQTVSNKGLEMPTDSNRPSSNENPQSDLVSASVPVATPEQAAHSTTNPWILLKVKALGELLPEAGRKLEELLDEGRMPREVSLILLQDHHVRLDELEVARYGAWLPHLRREAGLRAEERAENNVRAARERMKRRR